MYKFVTFGAIVNFRNKLIFYGEELLAPCPTLKLEDHPLSAVRDRPDPFVFSSAI
jgi:hypothetical protein